ncbi:hypothetical protein [Alicyclobacillus fastidiosus]|uniref:hypothetical protein n=1 Tax=Alicyclobacillus fastidiosus TaxID=392011 RepID=UPI0023E99D06|nr:hypothetical protein [Alicyclobacillus fastidiosus]GMA66113.1 hypothetical protein GCM10025859_65550 [Alicyclobacillus fastidiosus]
MDKDCFANHLGFDTWTNLVKGSQPVAAMHRNCIWYAVKTDTWYGWVAWNTNYDVLFSNASLEATLLKLKAYFDSRHIQQFHWFGAFAGEAALENVG